MNELEQLIEQYESENYPFKAVSYNGERNNMYSQGFVEWLATRPTCGVEQRKFLDEVEKLEYHRVHGLMYKECVAVDSNVFSAVLQKVVRGE